MATKSKKSGRNARRKDGPPKDVWKHAARPLRLGDERFKLQLLRPGNKLVADVTDLCTGFTWDDTSSELSGTAAFQRPPVRMPLNQTQRLRVRWRAGDSGAWEHLWTMKVRSPDTSLSSEASAVELTTTVTDVRKSRDDYRFKVTKTKPKGWTADEVTREVGRRTRMPLGRIAECSHRIKSLVQNDADPIDVIVKAYRAERRATGRRFFVRWDGRLNIEPMRRPRHLLDLAGVLIDASYKAELPENMATVVTVKATGKATGSKRKKRKIQVRVTSKDGVRTYGYVHRTVSAPAGTDTEREARAYAKRVLAKNLKPKQTLTCTVPLMPRLRRGDAFKVLWKSVGLTQIVFVGQASHEVSPGGGTTQITATFDDPYRDMEAERDKIRRERKARERRRSHAREAPKAPSGRRSQRRAS